MNLLDAIPDETLEQVEDDEREDHDDGDHDDEDPEEGAHDEVHDGDRKSTRLNSSHSQQSRMPSSA